MTALTKLTRVEAKLLLRDKVSVALILLLPTALTIAFGLIPGFKDPTEDLSGQSGIELIAAIAVALSITMIGLTILPTALAVYRERGILRRLGASPVRPRLLLGAQLQVYVAAIVLSIALVLGVGAAAVGLPMPAQFGGFVLAVVLGTLALFAVGLFIAAVSGTQRAASAFGMSLFFPSLFLAGVYVPREAMPAVLRQIGDFTPLGAALQSVRDSWSGHLPSALHIGTMAGYAVVASLAAARFFRWE